MFRLQLSLGEKSASLRRRIVPENLHLHIGDSPVFAVATLTAVHSKPVVIAKLSVVPVVLDETLE